MNTFTKLIAVGTMAVGALAFSASASAAAHVVECDLDYPNYNRTMTLTTTAGSPPATCHTSGLVNEKFDDLIWKIDFPSSTSGSGPNPFTSFSGGGGTAGSFVLNTTFAEGAIIVFKFGGGGAKNVPDWISYYINGMTAADWTWSGKQALSHVAIYGSTREVPEPATLALMGLGLLGVGLRMRRRKV